MNDVFNEKTLEDIVSEAYKECKDKDKTVPTINEIKNKIIYNIDAKAYDFRFGINKDTINSEIIVESLEKNRYVFYHEGSIRNKAQRTI